MPRRKRRRAEEEFAWKHPHGVSRRNNYYPRIPVEKKPWLCEDIRGRFFFDPTEDATLKFTGYTNSECQALNCDHKFRIGDAYWHLHNHPNGQKTLCDDCHGKRTHQTVRNYVPFPE